VKLLQREIDTVKEKKRAEEQKLEKYR